MKNSIDYIKARELLLSYIENYEDLTSANTAGCSRTEYVPLEESSGRILAFTLTARENVPSFDRSPYDGYAFRSVDTENASKEKPVTLRVVEEIPAGAVPTEKIMPGTAAKILTGAPIPEGADAVIMFEKTQFTTDEVIISESVKPGDNIVRIGEDVRKGELLAERGTVIDAGLAGTLAAQGIARPLVFKKPVVGIISTGSELAEFDTVGKSNAVNGSEVLDCCNGSIKLTDESKSEGYDSAYEQQLSSAGKIRNTNRYTFAAALQKDGCETVYLGTAGDDMDEITELIKNGLTSCDLLILTGGVSVGDYDLTPAAMERAGCQILANGVDLKPGMACCYGIAESKLVCGLSGNPSSSLTNYYAVVRPAIRKLAGHRNYLPETIEVTLAEDFNKKSKATRILKGRLDISGGKVLMHIPKGQGNVMIGSSIGCDVMAVVPAGSGAVAAGTKLEGFLV